MKTTSQDSKQNQSNNVDKTEKVAENAHQSDSQSSMPAHTVVMGDTLWNITLKLRPEGMPMAQAIEVLYKNNPQAFLDGDSAKLIEGSVLSFVSSDQDIDEKKRKDNDDRDAEAKQQPESDQQQAIEEDMSTASAGEGGAENSEVNDIAQALSERSNEGSEGGLSIVTIALGAAGMFGAASHYKNTNANEAPTFTSGSSAANITENSGANQVVYTAVATDDIDTEVTFSLSGADAGSFSINSASGQVRLNLNPNHEVKSQYIFTVVATDSMGKESSQAVSLQITDIDDAAPVITSANSGAVDENIAADTVIYTATADDSADVSDGVTFSLSGADADALTIDANTGEVAIKQSADYEVNSQYEFSFVATDAAGNASEAQAVTIDVNNLDEIAPTITSGATATSVDENIDAGQVIYTATATDIEDISAGVTFSLSGADASAFSIDENSGEVTLIASPDHEAKSAYSFDVIATDAAGNASAPTTVALNINDLDDAAPTVTSAATAAPVVENSAVDQVIYTAIADDSNDISDGVSFSLTGADADALTIDAETGEVRLKQAADHEAKSQYDFSVIATDAAGNTSESKAVVINVTDIDDAAPLITSENTAAVNENLAGQVIYNVTYDDSGDDQQDPVAYGFLDNSGNAVDTLITDDLNLSISTEGEITLNNTLDFEDKDTHSFIILVTNDQDFATKTSLDSRLGSVKQITLTVNNVDDTAPEVISSASAAAIDENGDDGQLVYTAIADDTKDVSDGVKFSLAGADAGAFSIDENTGAVTLNLAADFEAKSQYTFDVIAADLPGNVSSAKTVTLDINDIDEEPPVISSDA
ncbi:MAG: cadherin domain-containing protein, partial [Porticoccaceae bacterium]